MRKIFYIIVGIISVILGLIGIFLPILPTTPFLLLASFLFLNSSKKLHSYINNNKCLGEYIRDYEEKKAVKKSVKIKAIVFIWISILFSSWMFQTVWLAILLVVIAVSVTGYLFSLETL